MFRLGSVRSVGGFEEDVDGGRDGTAGCILRISRTASDEKTVNLFFSKTGFF